MASSTLEGLVANSGKLGYQLWHRPLKMASLVYEREIGRADILFGKNFELGKAASQTVYIACVMISRITIRNHLRVIDPSNVSGFFSLFTIWLAP